MSYLELGIKIIQTIESKGYLAYLIGGVVRDYLLSMPINDVDITTNMPLDELNEIFEIQENGVDYASVTIVYEGYKFEITHFRKDIKYINHRHPEIELCDDLYEDTKRRDFTINALAMDSNHKIIDYHNGLEDLKNKTIRAIFDPIIRFEEDSLRILRALHFSAKLDFNIDNETLAAMIKQKHLLVYLSNERIYEYIIKILYAKTNKGINYIIDNSLFDYIPSYNKLINIFDPKYKQADLALYYYYEYNEFMPIISTNDKKRCYILKELIVNNFDNYTLFKYQNELINLFDILFNLEYDIINIRENLNSLRIKNVNELAISTCDISKMFKGKTISIAIKEAVKAILDGRIENKEKDLLFFLQGLDVLKC